MMEKVLLVSDSDGDRARETGTSSLWYTVIHDNMSPLEQANKNPWNRDQSTYEKRCYLMDDCVVSFRPARFEDRIDRQQDHNKGLYFIEIGNHDGSAILTSRMVYAWEKVLEFANQFKGLSFTAATRVWKAKKL